MSRTMFHSPKTLLVVGMILAATAPAFAQQGGLGDFGGALGDVLSGAAGAQKPATPNRAAPAPAPAPAPAAPGLGVLGDVLNATQGGGAKAGAGSAASGASKDASRASSALGLADAVLGAVKEESVDEEIAVGQQTAAQVLGSLPLVKDARVQDYVSKVGLAVAARGERASLPWHFAVVDTNAINAFAMPGGIVLVTKGLYRLLGSEDELAAVLGHEIAHVQRQHHFKVIKKQKLMGAVSSAVTAEVAQGDALVHELAGRATEVMARGLDKDAEYEADRDGIVLAGRAGYDSSAMFAVLEKIAAAATKGGDASFLFSTHPAPGDRIGALAANIPAPVEAAAMPSAAGRRILAYALN